MYGPRGEEWTGPVDGSGTKGLCVYSDRRGAEGQRQRKGLAGWIKRRVCIAVQRAGLGIPISDSVEGWTVEMCEL